MQPKRISIGRAAGILLSAVFLVVIGLPLVGTLPGLAPRPKEGAEYRPLAEMPRLALNLPGLVQFRFGFEKYWNDRFGFRPLLVRAYSRLVVFGLRTSASPDVLLGREGWLFFTGDGIRADMEGRARLSEAELRRCRTLLEERRDWLERRGAHFLFVTVPNKDSVYAEFLPAWARRPAGASRMDQLLAYLREHSDVEVLDLRPALNAGRAQGLLYYRTDTHWNNRGAFTAYRALMQRLQPWVPGEAPLTERDFLQTEVTGYAGDLTRLLALEDDLREDSVRFELRRPPAAREVPVEGADWQRIGQRRVFARGDGKRILIFHDSYFGFLIPFLPEHFARTCFQWQAHFDTRLVEEERPDIVVHEACERLLLGALQENPEDISAERQRLRRLFDGDRSVSLLRLETPAALAALAPGSQVATAAAAHGLQLTSSGPDPFVWLPSLKVPAGMVPLVRVKMTASRDALARIYYWNARQASNSPMSYRAHWMPKGTGDLLFALADGCRDGDIRFDPAETPGEFVLSLVEVRGVPAQEVAAALETEVPARRP